MCNQFLGMVRQWQDLFYGKRYSASRIRNPDFARLAEAMGAKGFRIDQPDQVGDGLAALLKSEGPAVLEVAVEPEENVYPMVAAGKGLDQMDMGSLGVTASPKRNFKLQIANFKLQIEMQLPVLRSLSIANLQFAICNLKLPSMCPSHKAGLRL